MEFFQRLGDLFFSKVHDASSSCVQLFVRIPNRDPKYGNSFFEVKSSISEFEMTINEYKSMERNKENYEVVLVNRETREISRHKYSEIEELKQVNSYRFRFKQEKKT